MWKRIMTAMMMYAVLHGGNAFPIHAALLETPEGGVLLAGESGIGKTTSARRWRESGGVCPADDAVLLTRQNNGSFTAAPLPTWSRCEKSLDGCFFPIMRELPLAGILALDRAEKGKEEKIGEIPSSHFAAQIFRALFFPLLLPCRNLPDAEQKTFRDTLWETTGLLTRLFPPRALYAALNGNLMKTLEFYL
ncbi:MAG: hypothetical protein MJ016_08670 [Victivallaceae bacterium]|nr:hypothetical protein [Victivallaceae bacterium]